MKKVRYINLNKYSDDRGTLLPFEYTTNCPFEIKRAFILYDVPQNKVRGKHKNLISEHLLVPIKGSCKIKCEYENKTANYLLNTPEKGLYICSGVYKQMYDFSEDCILLCFANTKYDPKEYIE